MRSVRGEHGFTLAELLVGMSMMLIVLMATLTVLDVFQKDYKKDQIRNETQDSARSAIDRISRDLRSAVSPCGSQTGVSCTGATSGALQRATATDLIFQVVEPVQVFGAGNPSNQEWVRYCLDGSGVLWKDISTWTTSPPPAMPSTGACPGPTSQWPTQVKLLSNVIDQTDSPTHTLFTYYYIQESSGGGTISVPKSLQIDLDVQSTGNPVLKTNIVGGVDLRNSLASPTANFSCTKSGATVTCDASSSSDPNGQSLQYDWYQASSCSGAPVAVTQTYSPGNLSGTYTFALLVTDTAGLNNCVAQTFTF
jgi:prepilin-type N-terminal cleavage/methylation domain-containing protein